MAKTAVAKVVRDDDEERDGDEKKAEPTPKKGLVGRIFGLFGFLRYLNPLAILKLKGWLKYAALAGIVLVIAGGAAAFFFLGGSADKTAATNADGTPGPSDTPAVQATFYDVPDIIVNIQSADGAPAYLKLSVALELGQVDAKTAIEPLMPRVIDQFQAYLRELRVDDIRGSAGVMRLKEELLRRVNLAVAPTPVRDVLLKEMIVQ